LDVRWSTYRRSSAETSLEFALQHEIHLPVCSEIAGCDRDGILISLVAAHLSNLTAASAKPDGDAISAEMSRRRDLGVGRR
jgi:hypothetical protein